MGKYVFPRLTDHLAAVVSTHGYFEIQVADTYNSYASGIGPVHHHETRELLPPVISVYRGDTEELGLPYSADDDIPEIEYEELRVRLLRLVAEKGLSV